MGKNQNRSTDTRHAGKGGGRGAGRGGGRGVGRGVVKASHNSTSEALQRAIAETRKQQSAASSSVSLHLAQLSETACEEEETTAEQILDLVRSCFADSPSTGIPLTALGDRVRALASRTSGMAGLHKQVKDKWGGWDTFLRATAVAEFSVVAGVVHMREQRMEDEPAPAPPMRSLEPATRGDVNALSLESAALK